MMQLDLAPTDPAAAAPEAEEPAAEEPARLGRKRDHSRDPEILEAALDVLAETGYERMTIDQVAARAKAGKATLYRRWPSKAELVLDAVACLKSADVDLAALTDTGSLRGDLIAQIRPQPLEAGEKKMRVMAGLVSMLSQEPHFAEAAERVLVAPRIAIHRTLLERAIARGEVAADVDVATVAQVAPAMAAHRSLMLRQPVDRDFLVSVIDGVVLPAVGLRPPRA